VSGSFEGPLILIGNFGYLSQGYVLLDTPASRTVAVVTLDCLHRRTLDLKSMPLISECAKVAEGCLQDYYHALTAF
jgi:hypothetical protein